MRIYNIDRGDMNMRLLRAIAAGVPVAIALGVLYGFIVGAIRVEFSMLFVIFGYLVGQVVRKVGRGVTDSFRILAAVLTVIGIFIGDAVASYGLGVFGLMISAPALIPSLIGSMVSMHLSASINGLIGILFRVFGVYAAYMYAVIF